MEKKKTTTTTKYNTRIVKGLTGRARTVMFKRRAHPGKLKQKGKKGEISNITVFVACEQALGLGLGGGSGEVSPPLSPSPLPLLPLLPLLPTLEPENLLAGYSLSYKSQAL